jgi:IS1 family transposase
MRRLSTKERARIIACLVEGNSIRATVRLTGAAKKTVMRLVVEAGTACAEYQNRKLRNLACKRIQCDEIWSFVGAKDKNVPEEKRNKFGVGSVWTWTAIDADTKLIPCWFVGGRDAGAAYYFMMDLSERLTSRVQLTTDGHKAYLSAVESTFGIGVDYAQLVKIYGASPEGETRYSPAVCLGTEYHAITGDPDPEHISTSYVERHNLSIRMGNRRFTRLTNAFSKTIENHCHMLALWMMYYNFSRIHQTLRVSPAMAAGVSNHLWSVEDIAGLLDGVEPE